MSDRGKMKCRSCGCEMPEQILLTYKNMPKSAQFFPDAQEIEMEQGVDILLKQCPYCGLIQAAGQPVPYYRDVIRATGVSDEMRRFREKQYKKWVASYDLNGKNVIEIGCGTGEYMDMMEKADVQVYGLEHLETSVEKGRCTGHHIWQGFIENEAYRIPKAPYDGFYCMNFLEHIPEPDIFLRGICSNLKEAGIGLIEVPNFDMMVEKSLYSEFIQDHLSYFTKDTLCSLLGRNGFEVISCERIWYEYILSAVVRKRTMTRVDGFLQKQEMLKKELEAFIEEQQRRGKKTAVWGAGHQALANLALLELADKIVYVVDSAGFKQNKFTPATHIPVVAPERLKENEVHTVIIMAAGYSREVKRIMERDYPWIESIIVTEDGLLEK